LLAAIAHDIGHLSFGHFLEEMKGLFRGRMHEDYAAAVLASAAPRDAAAVLLSDRKSLRSVAKEFWTSNADPQPLLSHALAILHGVNATTALVDPDAILSQTANAALKVDVLHSIIDSAIDADKLDYLARDAHHCNVQYSKGVDIDRFLQSLTTLPHVDHHMITTLDGGQAPEPRDDDITPPTPHACVGVTEKGVAPVESILVARYHMFSAVYWQHTARALTAMLQFVIQEYVAGDAKHSDERIGSVIDEFREREDIDALQWLRSVVTDPDRVRSAKARKVLGQMCRGLLGDREAVHWPAFELRYGRSADAADLAVGLMRHADAMHAAPDGFSYVKRCRTFRRQLSEHLASQLGHRIAFSYGDLLIDIPPSGKDQIDNIFVIADGTTRPIQDVSPVANAIRDSFRYWVRKVRVFLSPAAWSNCRRVGISDDELHRSSWNALHAFLVSGDNVQLSLASAPAAESRRRRQEIPEQR
jgi:HD associated region